MAQKVANGEALTREDLTGRQSVTPETRERLKGLRQLSPEERAEAWRSLSPEERRLIAEELRARRAARRPQQPAPQPVPSQDSVPPSE